MFCAGDTDNQYTIEGTTLPDRVHITGDIQRGETWQIRAIGLKSEQYRLIGKSDLIEAESVNFIQSNTNRDTKANGIMMSCKFVPKPYV